MSANNLTRYERETIITFNEEEKEAECFTYNARRQRELLKYAQERPDECRLIEENDCGGMTFRYPKAWEKVRPPRILTAEEKAALAERMRRVK